MIAVRFFLLQFKLLIKRIPQMILVFLLVVFLALCTLFMLNRIYDKLSPTEKEKDANYIAVVCPDEDNTILKYAKDILDQVMGSASSLFMKNENDKEGGNKLLNMFAGTGDLLKFKFMEEDEALNAIKNNQILAVLYLGQDDLNKIQTCQTAELKIIVRDDSEYIPVICVELVNSFARLLTAAQASSLAIYDIYTNTELDGSLYGAMYDIDMSNFSYAMHRNSVYQRVTVDFSTTNSPISFYTATALTFMLFLVISAFTPALSDYEPSFCKCFKTRGIGIVGFTIIRLVSFFVFQFVTLTAVYSLVYFAFDKYFNDIFNEYGLTNMLGLNLSYGKAIPIIAIFALFSSAYVMFIISLIKNSEESLMIFFMFAAGLMLLSGCIIPSAFFPATFRSIMTFLPAWYIHKLFLMIIEGVSITKAGMVTYGIVCSLLLAVSAVLINVIRLRTDSNYEK